MLNKTNMEETDPEFFHFTPVHIRFNDIDIMGHVNNAVFQDYFDYARLSYFSKVFGEPLSWDSITLILAHICIDYHQTVHLNDEILIASKITLIGNKSLQMTQEVHKMPEKKLMASSHAVLVAIDAASNCSVSVPEKWKEQITAFEKRVGFKYR